MNEPTFAVYNFHALFDEKDASAYFFFQKRLISSSQSS